MEINLTDTVMVADTPAECTIAEAEATADRLRQLSKNLTRIVIRAEKTQEIDTAYFQILVALKAFADQQRIPCVMEMSPAVNEMCQLYGIDLAVMIK
jgi:anti-anti-sigma regulatory factor